MMKGLDVGDLQQRGTPRTAPALQHGGTLCQHSGDVKGFKGRGAHRAVRDAHAAVDSVHAAMNQLMEAAKDFERRTKVRVLDLALHRRSGTQQHSLRWRQPGSGGRHVGWHQVEQQLVPCSQLVREHYLNVTAQARELNQQEKLARAVLRRARARRDTFVSLDTVMPQGEG